MKRSNLRPTLLALVLAAPLELVVPPPPVLAQVPEKFTNLQILDENIEQRQLVGIMRGFANGLGVRCNHCHVGPDNLEGMDFASDEKETKRAARVMLTMTRAINAEYVGSWNEDEEVARQSVACFTCHRGQPKPPRKLSAVLAETALADGADAAMIRYRKLEEEHRGSGVYDFRERELIQLARTVYAQQGETGIQILRSALEIHPRSADLHMFLGLALMETGDTKGAAAKFDDALAIDPEHGGARRAKMMLEQSPQEGDGP